MTAGDLDFRDRDRLFAAADAERFDLAVIGGGITGAGVARDAAMRGLKVVLVEARDFASGTSSRSSKMIHGGLRYLAQGDLALVREAASERKIVEAIAPHLARETPFVIPARSAGAIARLRAGMWTFEKLGGVAKRRRHQVWSKSELKGAEPALQTAGLAGAVVYPEFLTNDARLTLANVRSAVAHGALALNYARAEALVIEGGKAVGVRVAEGVPGASERRARVQARLVVNAAGPWVDEVRSLESASAPARLELTRGVHLVVAHARLPISRTIIMSAADRRGVFAVPKGAMSYIGTTDTFYPKPVAWPAIRPEDVAYLLATAAATFCSEPISAEEITSAWSGVRPLVAQEGKSASEISRRDELWTGPAGMLSIAGGKLTAYRQMAERVVDEVEKALGRKPTPCTTAKAPLIGGDVDPDGARQTLRSDGLGENAADRLVELYGAEAQAIAAAGATVEAEASHAVLAEGALTLEDYWVRRSARAWFDPDGGIAALAPAAAAMAPLLGWSSARADAEIAGCAGRHGHDMAAVRAPVGAAESGS